MNLASPIKLTYHHASNPGLESLMLSPAKGYVILGSYSNVEDRLPWQRNLANFIEEKLNQNIPTLGVCFGHQLMADRYGSHVAPNTKERNLSHEGTRKIQIKPNKFNITAGEKEFFVAHSFQIEKLSDQFETIATSPECPFDGIQHKTLPFVGFQAHPEASTTFAREAINNSLDQDQMNAGLENGLSLMLDYFQFVKNL